MDWWYKSEKHKVTSETIGHLQDAVRSVLRDGKSLASVHLYDDKIFFYIKTTNKISLNHFLFQNGFEELDEEKTTSDLNLLFGAA
ncbi:MAG: hypothetical protein PSX36_05480 [bacterium]|nr:hypothetical protein [bacterium]